MLEIMLQVEANDAVAVASTTKPKSQPNEILVDMAVSAATKLQRLRVCSVPSLSHVIRFHVSTFANSKTRAERSGKSVIENVSVLMF